MPTFKVFHKGACVETIQGANPSALSAAVLKAKQLCEGRDAGELFKSPGRTLGGGGGADGGSAGGQGVSFNYGAIIQAIIGFIGLYIVSLLTARNQKQD